MPEKRPGRKQQKAESPAPRQAPARRSTSSPSKTGGKKTANESTATNKSVTSKTSAKKTPSDKRSSYHQKKEFEGKKYSGMRVGRVHKWDYPDGVWHEKKVEPSRWEIGFAAHKHRKARAPQGSGAEPGSGYHWLIVADQWVRKVDANTYATLMEGEKHLVSFQKPEWSAWNTQFGNQRSARQKTIKILRETLERLEAEEAAESIEEPWHHPAFMDVGVPEAKPPVIEDLVPKEVLARLMRPIPP